MTVVYGPNLALLIGADGGEGHDAALRQLLRGMDGLIQASVKDKDLATPPGSPADGDRYIVAASPTGAWVGHTDKIARWSSSAVVWEFYAPKEGWTVGVDDEDMDYRYDGSLWAALPTVFSPVVTDATTARTLSFADINKYIRMTSSSANAVTVPANSTTAFQIGTEISVRMAGTGQTSFTAAGGVTLNSAPSLNIKGQHYTATLKKVATDTWDVIGAML